MYAKLALAALVSTFVLVPAAEASYLCASPSGAVKLRAECRRSETQIDPDEIGFRGSTGPQGAAGAQGQSGVAGPQGAPGNASDGRSLENLVTIAGQLATGTPCVSVTGGSGDPYVYGPSAYNVPAGTRFILTGVFFTDDAYYVLIVPDMIEFLKREFDGPTLATAAERANFAQTFPAGLAIEAGRSILFRPYSPTNCSGSSLNRVTNLPILTGYLIPDE